MTDTLHPIETCPNGHRYNTWKYDDTCPVCGAKVVKEKEKTPEQLKQEKEEQLIDRVCGWLVCVHGPNEGKGYVIKAGKNFIGSDPNMDIYIQSDKKVDKKNHAIVLYDEKTRETKLLPGESRGMVYHQNTAVYDAMTLEEMDEIQLGNSLFFFVPFCSKEFDWNDLTKKYKEES